MLNSLKPTIALLMRAKTNQHIHDQYFINQDYVTALTQTNAYVQLIYPMPYDELKVVLSRVDGLVIPGGMDVDPHFYHQENIASNCEPVEIDQLDLDAIQIAESYNLPVLGICRGLQIINVAYGGTLKQDIPNHSLSNHIHKCDGHLINIFEDSFLIKLLGRSCTVNSYHHQAIDQLATNFKVVATSDDGLIEAIESTHIWALQWHPERMIELKVYQELFKAFVEQCR